MQHGNIDRSRRDVLRSGGAAGVLALLVAAGIVRPLDALAADSPVAFDAKTLQDVFKALGAGSPQTSAEIEIKAPSIAENGAVVPVTVESKIAGTESITILVAKNPTPLAASFNIPSGTEPMVTTRVKMGETSDIYALVKAPNGFYMAKKEIKVTLGGCGG